MTDNHIDEKLIASFFEAHQIGEIEDRGFSRRVMRRLPESRMRRLNTVWTLLCMVAVVVYFIMQQGTKVLLVALTHLWSSLSEAVVMPDLNMTTALLTYVGLDAVMIFGVYHVLKNVQRYI